MDNWVSEGELWVQVGLDTRGVAAEGGGAGASGAETGWTGSAQNKLAPKTQKSESETEITTVPDIPDLKHTCSHGDAGCAPDTLGRRLKFPLSLQQHLDLEMYRRSKQKSNRTTPTLHRGVSRTSNTSFSPNIMTIVAVEKQLNSRWGHPGHITGMTEA